jgi:hypothetical protein
MAYTKGDLHTAELHIMQAQRSLATQRARVLHLEERGLPAATAKALVETFETTLATLQRHRDHIATALERQGDAKADPVRVRQSL